MLLQLNPEKKEEYSSEKTFAKGDILELDEDGRIEQNGYEGVAKKNIFGFYTVSAASVLHLILLLNKSRHLCHLKMMFCVPLKQHYHFSHCCSFDEWNDM